MTSLDAKFERLLHSPKQELLNSMQASSEGEVMKQPASRHYGFAQPAVLDLKRKSVIGGIAAVSAQGVKLFLQMATTMVLARLLSPKDRVSISFELSMAEPVRKYLKQQQVPPFGSSAAQ